MILGWIAMGSISVILAFLASNLYSISKSISVVCIFVSISPPILLLIERSNFDWLVFICVFIAAFCFSENLKTLGFLLLLFSSLLKFYTFPLLILSLFFLKSRRGLYLGFLLTLVAFSQIIIDILHIRSISIGAWFAAFGNSIWAKYLVKLDINLGTVSSTLLGLALTFFLIVFLKRVINFQVPVLGKPDQFSLMDFFALFATVTFIGCYFVGLNFDYRLIFLLPSLWFFIKNPNNSDKKYVLTIYLIAFFSSYNIKFLQPLGDLSINVLVAIQLLVLCEFISQLPFIKYLIQRFRHTQY